MGTGNGDVSAVGAREPFADGVRPLPDGAPTSGVAAAKTGTVASVWWIRLASGLAMVVMGRLVQRSLLTRRYRGSPRPE